MRVKELKGKYGRPDWNPAIEIRFEVTKSLLESIKIGMKKEPFYVDEEDFIVSAIREKLKRLGVKHFMEPPKDERD